MALKLSRHPRSFYVLFLSSYATLGFCGHSAFYNLCSNYFELRLFCTLVTTTQRNYTILLVQIERTKYIYSSSIITYASG